MADLSGRGCAPGSEPAKLSGGDVPSASSIGRWPGARTLSISAPSLLLRQVNVMKTVTAYGNRSSPLSHQEKIYPSHCPDVNNIGKHRAFSAEFLAASLLHLLSNLLLCDRPSNELTLRSTREASPRNIRPQPGFKKTAYSTEPYQIIPGRVKLEQGV
jgi:hypothetical protein